MAIAHAHAASDKRSLSRSAVFLSAELCDVRLRQNVLIPSAAELMRMPRPRRRPMWYQSLCCGYRSDQSATHACVRVRAWFGMCVRACLVVRCLRDGGENHQLARRRLRRCRLCLCAPENQMNTPCLVELGLVQHRPTGRPAATVSHLELPVHRKREAGRQGGWERGTHNQREGPQPVARRVAPLETISCSAIVTSKTPYGAGR